MATTQPTNAGIVTDASGVRHIPESTRADGSTRRAIKIRPGYQPPEDVALYKNRTAESFRNRYKGGVPGAEGVTAPTGGSTSSSSSRSAGAAAAGGAAATTTSAAANKNAKRREARKKAAAAASSTGETAAAAAEETASAAAPAAAPAAPAAAPPPPEVDPEAEREKKARGLRKKLKQARDLQSKRDGGATLLPEQIAKVIRINELIRELDALGLDADGAAKTDGATKTGDATGPGKTT